MISKYKDYLEEKLRVAGVKGKIYHTEKELKLSSAVHLGAILFSKEKFEKDGSKKIYQKEDAMRVKRVCKLKRITEIVVVIGDSKEENCEEIFSNFLSMLDSGMDDGSGNYIEIEALDSDWVYDKDNILKSKTAVMVWIRFTGGIYVDIPLVKINEFEIESEMIKG